MISQTAVLAKTSRHREEKFVCQFLQGCGVWQRNGAEGVIPRPFDVYRR